MSNCGLTEQDLLAITKVFADSSQIEEARLFGSRAKGNFKTGSDVDIALKGNKLTAEIVNHISYLLNEESLMPYKFDIVNYQTINNSDLLEHIDRVGIRLFARE